MFTKDLAKIEKYISCCFSYTFLCCLIYVWCLFITWNNNNNNNNKNNNKNNNNNNNNDNNNNNNNSNNNNNNNNSNNNNNTREAIPSVEFKKQKEKELKEKWSEKRMHGQFIRKTMEKVDKEKTWQWLSRGDLKVGTEALLCAAQKQAIRTNYMK